MINVEIVIMPKQSILDPQSQAITSSLNLMGFNNVKQVSYGRIIKLQIDTDSTKKAQDITEEMCHKILVNSLIEDYIINII